jgi:hypothetical protein
MKGSPCFIVVATAAVLAVTPARPAGAQSREVDGFLQPPPVSAPPDARPPDPSAPRPPRAQSPKRFYVLSIGINEYRDPAVQDLNGAVNDARRVADLFGRQAPGSTVRLLLDQDATRNNVLSALRAIKDEAGPDDFIVIFLSGHGGSVGGDWRFNCHDSPLVGGELAACLNDLTDLEHFRSRPRKVLVAIDACHAGQLAREVGLRSLMSQPKRHSLTERSNPGSPDEESDPILGRFFRKEAKEAEYGELVFLASCQPSELSRDGVENGLFTKALLEALRGASDADRDGLVTVKELRAFMAWRMDKLVYKIPKLPGLAWPEQNCLSLASLTVDESLPITRSEGGEARDEIVGDDVELYSERALLHRQMGHKPVQRPESVTGTWRTSWPTVGRDGRPLVGRDGRPRVSSLSLTFDEDGSYLSVLRDGKEVVNFASGTYLYESRRGQLVEKFELNYINGKDYLRIESSTDDRLTIYAFPSQAYQPPQKFNFERVKQGEGPR